MSLYLEHGKHVWYNVFNNVLPPRCLQQPEAWSNLKILKGRLLVTSIHSFKRNFNYPRPRKGKQSPARLTTQQYTRIHTKRIISRRKEVR